MYNKDDITITETVDCREGRGYYYSVPLPEDIDHLDFLYEDEEGEHYDLYTDYKNNRLWGAAVLKGTILYCY